MTEGNEVAEIVEDSNELAKLAEVAEIIRHTDLAAEVPTVRADPVIETIRVSFKAGWGAIGGTVQATNRAGGEPHAVEVLLLVIAGCLLGGLLLLAGAPVWLVCCIAVGPWLVDCLRHGVQLWRHKHN